MKLSLVGGFPLDSLAKSEFPSLHMQDSPAKTGFPSSHMQDSLAKKWIPLY